VDGWVLPGASLEALEKSFDGSGEEVELDVGPSARASRRRASRSERPQVPHSMMTVRPMRRSWRPKCHCRDSIFWRWGSS
jgi:hypothetical protein